MPSTVIPATLSSASAFSYRVYRRILSGTDFAQMNESRSGARSPYMEWAKLYSASRYNLANSGMASLPLADLGVVIEQLEINGPGGYGYGPLLAAISGRYRVPQESIVSAIGTSMANY